MFFGVFPDFCLFCSYVREKTQTKGFFVGPSSPAAGAWPQRWRLHKFTPIARRALVLAYRGEGYSHRLIVKKVQAAEDAWSSRDPERISLAYSEDTEWRNRNIFINGRAEVVEFLKNKWECELDYRLKKTL